MKLFIVVCIITIILTVIIIFYTFKKTNNCKNPGSICQIDKDCCSNNCTNNICSNNCIKLNQSCNQQTCCKGLNCYNGKCIYCSKINEPCDNESDCCTGYCNHGVCTEQKCNIVKSGGTCNTNNDCCDTLYCKQNVCTIQNPEIPPPNQPDIDNMLNYYFNGVYGELSASCKDISWEVNDVKPNVSLPLLAKLSATCKKQDGSWNTLSSVDWKIGDFPLNNNGQLQIGSNCKDINICMCATDQDCVTMNVGTKCADLSGSKICQ